MSATELKGNDPRFIELKALRHEVKALRAKLAAAENVVQAIKDLRTSEDLGAVQPPDHTPFYVLTVKSYNALVKSIEEYDKVKKDK